MKLDPIGGNVVLYIAFIWLIFYADGLTVILYIGLNLNCGSVRIGPICSLFAVGNWAPKSFAELQSYSTVYKVWNLLSLKRESSKILKKHTAV